jgi:hypothetical protein
MEEQKSLAVKSNQDKETGMYRFKKLSASALTYKDKHNREKTHVS